MPSTRLVAGAHRVIVRAAVIPLATCLFSSGCEEPRPALVPVSGQVLLDGAPLSMGVVRVLPAGHRSASGRIDSDGRFVLSTYERGDGCVVGTHPAEIVAINNQEETGAVQTRAAPLRWAAPARYADHRTSGLTVEIDGPTDALVVSLDSTPH